MITTLAALAALTGDPAGFAGDAPGMDFHLPMEMGHMEGMPEPAELLGFEVGEWHVSHDRVVEYFRLLAEASDRVTVEVIGRTWEHRPLIQAVITAPANRPRLEALRTRDYGDPGEMPVVLMGYSVHGNEASGTNAALLVAYHLAASKDPEVLAWLENMVIIIDPAMNPDGITRFATWVNSQRGYRKMADPVHRERDEPWPNGRTNHYWFDLNRDWLLLQHPESRARVARFHQWHPHVVTDVHEMGPGTTYFFQPGVPTRQYPLTPARNVELTEAIGRYHSRALDAVGERHYSRESFDDFYLGKGSTYPDLNGSIGILFEQASTRGHRQSSAEGVLTFSEGVRNHVATSFSTLRATLALREKLMDHQRTFYVTALEEARRDPAGGVLLAAPLDPVRLQALVDILVAHHIDVRRVQEPVVVGGREIPPGKALFVPYEQPQYRMAKALFERRTQFEDDEFYDVSTWNMGDLFNLYWNEIPRRSARRLDTAPLDVATLGVAASPPDPDAIAWVVDWRAHHAPRALSSLLEAGVRVRVAERSVTVATADGPEALTAGALLVPADGQARSRADIVALLRQAAAEGVPVHGAISGQAVAGIDLGSPSWRPLAMPRVLLVGGDGVDGYEAGEAWFHMDRRLHLPVTVVDRVDLGSIVLDDYTHLVLVTGKWDSLSGEQSEAIRDWVEGGGVLMAQRDAAAWVRGLGWVADTLEVSEESPESIPLAANYENRARARARRLISGALVEAEFDPTHPMAWGLTGNNRLPVFRRGTLFLPPSDSPWVDALVFTDEPLLAGYVAEENLDRLAGSVSLKVLPLGEGRVVLSADNYLFRAITWGTSRVFSNALFFATAVDVRPTDAGMDGE